MQAGPLLVAYAIDRAVPALPGRRPRAADRGGASATCCARWRAGGLQYAFIRASARVNQDVLLDLRGRIFRHAQALSVDFHERYTSGRLISRSTTDVESLRELLSEGLQELIGVILSFVYISAMLLWLDLGLGAAARGLLRAAVPARAAATSGARRGSTGARSTAIAAVIVKFAETMNGIRPVRAFRREAANDADFGALNQRPRAHQRRRAAGDGPLCRRLPAGRQHGGRGDRAVGRLPGARAARWRSGCWRRPCCTCGGCTTRSTGSACSSTPTSRRRPRWRRSRACWPRPRPCRSPRDPRHAAAAAATELPGREVVFDDVRFAYRTGGEVLPRFDLTLPAGQTVAVVGSTGAGKSTLAKLLARFYDPTEGRVLLDGVDLRELAMPELRRGVVMVTQEAFLFSGTVAENIAIGRPDATREDIEQAAKAIGAHDFISALPDGYDTDVRKRGGRISAGQRQLVAFARALLADPAVLILDEATSSLDIPGERAVQRAMATVLQRPYGGGDRPPAVDGRDRRPGPGDGARPDRRGRHPGRTHRGHGPVRGPAPGVAGQPGVGRGGGKRERRRREGRGRHDGCGGRTRIPARPTAGRRPVSVVAGARGSRAVRGGRAVSAACGWCCSRPTPYLLSRAIDDGLEPGDMRALAGWSGRAVRRSGRSTPG